MGVQIARRKSLNVLTESSVFLITCAVMGIQTVRTVATKNTAVGLFTMQLLYLFRLKGAFTISEMTPDI